MLVLAICCLALMHNKCILKYQLLCYCFHFCQACLRRYLLCHHYRPCGVNFPRLRLEIAKRWSLNNDEGSTMVLPLIHQRARLRSMTSSPWQPLGPKGSRAYLCFASRIDSFILARKLLLRLNLILKNAPLKHLHLYCWWPAKQTQD